VRDAAVGRRAAVETARRRREAGRHVEAADGPATTWQEISPYVDEALAALPDESRELLVSHFLRGKSQSAIAVDTRTSPATVSRRMRDAVAALRAELRRRGVTVAPALLVGLCRMNAAAEAAPAALVAELGKMALVGNGAAAAGAAPFAWTSVSAWCDAAARTWGWPAELVKQAVAAAATSAVALALGLMIARGFGGANRHPVPGPEPARHAAAAAAPATVRPSNATTAGNGAELTRDVRVAPAGDRDPLRVVLFRWPEAPGGPIALTYGDGRTVARPAPVARKLVETQAGKTLEQLARESRPPR
jgi:hypothetical protein